MSPKTTFGLRISVTFYLQKPVRLPLFNSSQISDIFNGHLKSTID